MFSHTRFVRAILDIIRESLRIMQIDSRLQLTAASIKERSQNRGVNRAYIYFSSNRIDNCFFSYFCEKCQT